MLFVSLRDLQWRIRRFLIGVVATGLVFALALLISGINGSFQNEVVRTVRAFGVDRWVVSAKASGPFTSSTLVPDSTVDAVRRLPGVRAADPVDILHFTVQAPTVTDLNVIGVVPRGLGNPKVRDGRAIATSGEVVADRSLGLGVGKTLRLGDSTFTVVGRTSGVSFDAGTPVVFTTLADAQKLVLEGVPLATAIVTRGVPTVAPKGLAVMTNAAVMGDLKRPLRKATKTIAFLRALLWIVAAGIIGSVLYLQALERTRDFAVFKATGVSNRSLLTGIALQAVLLAIMSALAALLIAWLLAPTMTIAIEVPESAYVALPIVAVVVGLISSLFGLRRAVTVDPALAFGG